MRNAELEKLAGPVHEQVLNPLDYISQRLKAVPTASQANIVKLLRTPPYKVLVRSGHNLGKSWLAAAIANWWHDTFRPGIVLTTAPNEKQVKDILWKEIRTQRRRAGLDMSSLLPKACRMETAPDHFAHGFTARDRNSFQGQHGASILIIFDEGEGVAQEFWDAADTMLSGDNYGFLAIYNPYAQSSPAAQAERSGQYHVVTMSALDHPNILRERDGLDAEYRDAIRLGPLLSQIQKLCQRCEPELPGAFEFMETWWLPSPLAQAGILGRRPTAGFRSVWPDEVFDACVARFIPLGGPVQVGMDVGEWGDDATSLCVRQGGNILDIEEWYGLKDHQAADRCRQFTHDWATRLHVEPKRVPIVVDCGGGYGQAPLMRLVEGGFLAVPIKGSWTAWDEEHFPNLRSQLWFDLADLGQSGQISLANLSLEKRELLRRELTAPEYTIDVHGRRTVEIKLKTKERIGRSPDNADSTHYAFANVGMIEEKIAGRLDIP